MDQRQCHGETARMGKLPEQLADAVKTEFLVSQALAGTQITLDAKLAVP